MFFSRRELCKDCANLQLSCLSFVSCMFSGLGKKVLVGFQCHSLSQLVGITRIAMTYCRMYLDELHCLPMRNYSILEIA